MNTSGIMRLTVVLATTLLSACILKTGGMSRLKPIPIPDGLSDREAIGGVVLATDPSRMPAAWQDMTFIASRFVLSNPYNYPVATGFVLRPDPYGNSRWRVEEVADRYAVLGFTASANKHYIRVKYSIEEGNLIPSVLDADNMLLNDSKTRMHKGGLEWINRNIAIIREGMWQVKTIKEAAADPGADLRVRKAELSVPEKKMGQPPDLKK